MRSLSLYVHVPFCTVKCGYCDFNAYAGMDRLKEPFTEAAIRELRAWAVSGSADRPLYSFAFGGGTPGELSADAIARILDAARESWSFEPGAEVSLEANPGTSNGPYLSSLCEAGVNRISFGAQSFDPDELRLLDRIHSVEAIGASIKAARVAGIASVGLDLMYGLPGQPPARWEENLRRAIAIRPDHVSCYALTIEEGTGFGARVARGELIPPDDDLLADFYETARVKLADAGYVHYELSNWALPGHASRHNQVYWTDGDYIGIGPGAHGFLNGIRYENVAHPKEYVAAADRAERPDERLAGIAVANAYAPSPVTEMADWLLLRLRLLDGVTADAFRNRFNRELYDVIGTVVAELAGAGVLNWDGHKLSPTPRGLLLHGEIAARLLRHLEDRAPDAIPA